jgi:hypothetical protein
MPEVVEESNPQPHNLLQGPSPFSGRLNLLQNVPELSCNLLEG